MITLHRRTISAAVLTLALAGAIAGCSDDEGTTAPGVNPAVLGTWNATSFLVAGVDLIAQGVDVTLTLNSNGTYGFDVTNDQGGALCDQGTACSDPGTYTATDTQIFLDAGTTDATTLSYSISGTTMTVTGTVDGQALVIVFSKA